MTADVRAPRIGGWLWAPVAYLGATLLSATLMLVLLALQGASTPLSAAGYATLATTALMWLFTLWTLRALLRRSRRFPRIFILWLMTGVLLALKTFAFAPITDDLALRVLFWPLLAAALLVPYIKRSQRVKRTFTQP